MEQKTGIRVARSLFAGSWTLTARLDDDSALFKVPNRVSAKTAQSDTVETAISEVAAMCQER
jgi:hypothetical protein